MNGRRVLWFINKPPAAVARSLGATSVRGGWLDAYIDIASAEPDIDLTVAFPDETGRAGTERIGSVTCIGLPTGEPPSGIGGVPGRWRHDVAPPEALAAAARLVEQVRPDLIHLHGADWTCYGLAVRGSGVPTLLSIQGSPTQILRLAPRGMDRYYRGAASLREFVSGRGHFHDTARMKARAANEARVMSSVGHVAGRTEWDRELAAEMAPQALYHHLDEPMRDAFHEKQWRAQDAVAHRIVSMGGDYARKGVGTLLRAVDIVRRAEPDVMLTLAGVGPGTTLERAATRHVRALGIGDNVDLRGDIDADSVAGELARAGVFVIASHIENSSNALCEAQLIGVPCIASRVGGLVTLADGGSAATLFTDGDAHGLAEAILADFASPAGAARRGARGRELARVRHDPARIREQLLAIYDGMRG